MENQERLSALLSRFSQELQKRDAISLQEICTFFEERTFFFLLIIISAVIAVPIPLPGIKSVMALPCLLLTFQVMIGRKTPWLPKKIGATRLSSQQLNNSVTWLLKHLRKLENRIRPNMLHLSSERFEPLVSLGLLIISAFILLPAPGTNEILGLGVLVTSIGMLERDGRIILGGLIWGLCVCVGMALLVWIFGTTIFHELT